MPLRLKALAARRIATSFAIGAAIVLPSAAAAQRPQNPSPMVESTRAHERLAQRELDGASRTFSGPGDRPVDVFVPRSLRAADTVHLVIHFHGAAWLAQQAVNDADARAVAAVVNLGAGSSIYDRTYSETTSFDSLVGGVLREVSAVTGRAAHARTITLTAFSAGHGAVRAILRQPRHFAAVNAVLLLDGMHTSYIPEGTVVAEGGALDTTNLAAFARFAEAAARGEKRFLVTHSEIFPGTFASTTETADWLVHALGLRRTAVLQWGPRGMQQLSEVRAGGFELFGYAGNTAPDHIDHFHAMPELLGRVLGGR